MSRPVNLKDEAERVLARMQGRLTYKASNPCKWGHWERYATSGGCVECMKEKYSLYHNPVKQMEMRRERMANGEWYIKI